MWFATNHLGQQLVKCSECEEIYPACEHWCPECGSSISIILWKDEYNEKSESN